MTTKRFWAFWAPVLVILFAGALTGCTPLATSLPAPCVVDRVVDGWAVIETPAGWADVQPGHGWQEGAVVTCP